MRLHAGEFEVTSHMYMTSRDWAADVLEEVAEACRAGRSIDITLFDFGRAIGRAASNSDEEEKLDEIIRGYRRYLSLKE